ncbi:MAG: heavy metal translocating P-type ATPase [Cyanobacteria bacterium J06626_6]
MNQLAPSPESTNQTSKATSTPLQQALPPSRRTEGTDAANSETWVLDIEGMMCAGCVSTVEKKLSQCKGVRAARVNLVTEVAAIDCDSKADPQAIAQMLTAAGYPSKLRQRHAQRGLTAETDWLSRKETEQQQQTLQLAIAAILLTLSVLGHLQHLSLANQVAQALQTLPIISTLWFHGTLATLTLIFPARKILIEGIQGVWRGTPNMNTLVTLGALSAYLASVAALIFPDLGWECFFDEPVMLLSFILMGRTLEQRARFRAASSLRSLIALQPGSARLIPSVDKPENIDKPENTEPSSQNSSLQEAGSVQIPASQVQIGEWLRVLPGEKVPADGIITTGQTALDESMLTGESMPVVKQSGDPVVAGSLNQSGVITLAVTKTGADTALGQMIQLVETAQTRKAPIQGLADLISGYFTYGVLTCAVLTFCFWYFIGASLWPEVAQSTMGHMHLSHLQAGHMHPMPGTTATLSVTQSLRWLISLKLAIAVVVVACPCALGLATPTAILVGSGIGADRGILIRGGDILEATHQLDTLIFDKTGTLTTGSPQVTDCLPLVPNLSAERLLQLAATAESGTRHPLAIAIQKAATQQQLPLLAATQFHTQAGLGVSAQLADQAGFQQILLGNRAWLSKNHCPVDAATIEQASGLAKAGKTVVFVALDRQISGLIGVRDQLRPEAAQAIEQLQTLGLSVQILSGDRQEAADAIGAQLQLGPAQVKAEVAPQAKVSAIAHLQQAGHQVGFIGDGINDAPALAQADVGIALHSGTEVAIEAADIVLMGDTLSDIATTIDLSRTTFHKIRQNLTWAFSYNLICIPLAAGVFLPALGLSLNPGFAGGLMALSSITVIVNSLLLRLWRPQTANNQA